MFLKGAIMARKKTQNENQLEIDFHLKNDLTKIQENEKTSNVSEKSLKNDKKNQKIAAPQALNDVQSSKTKKDNNTNSTYKGNIVINKLDKDAPTNEEKVSTKKIDNYVAPVSPHINEFNALTSFFNSSIGKEAVIETTSVDAPEQKNYPPLKGGYTISFEYDESPNTLTLHNRVKAVVRPMGGTVSDPSVFGGGYSLPVHLPLTLEETTAFFDKFLKVQFQSHIKMSGTIYQETYSLSATASEEKIAEIKADWIKFSKGGNRRELIQGKNFLTLIFNTPDDYIRNSAILGISGTEIDGVKFSTDVENISIKDAKNYNPDRVITPD